MKSIGEQFYDARMARGWTMQELADASGLAVSVIWKLEHDESVRKATVEAAARALGATVEQRLVPEETLQLAEPPDALAQNELERRREVVTAALNVHSSYLGMAARVLRALPLLSAHQRDVMLAFVALIEAEQPQK